MSDLPLFVLNVLALDAVDMSSDKESLVYDLAEVSGYAVHSIFTGSPVGNLIVWGGDTLDSSLLVPIDTYGITEAGRRLLNVEKTQYRYVWITYDATSGSGSLTSRISAKRV